jgi:hypothetical protein
MSGFVLVNNILVSSGVRIVVKRCRTAYSAETLVVMRTEKIKSIIKRSEKMDEVVTCMCGCQSWVIGKSGIRCSKCSHWIYGLEINMDITKLNKEIELQKIQIKHIPGKNAPPLSTKITIATSIEGQVLEVFNDWSHVLAGSAPCTGIHNECVKNMFENLGFSNVVVHSDGKTDGTREGERFSGMYISGIKTADKSDETVVLREVPWDDFQQI